METETISETFTIKTPIFEGPFALLLSLIEERKLFINDLSLAQVTEDYIHYINSQEGNLPTEKVTSFVVVASTLLLIKSKSLLPSLTLTEEEESDILNLEDRLKQYEFYSKLSKGIKEKFGKEIIFAPLERKNQFVVFLPDESITKESMMTLANDIIGRIPKKVSLPKVEIKKVISIEEMIDKLTERIERSLSMSFRDFSGKAATKEEKVNVIVGFLAVLEMARQGILNLVQENNFEDIIIEKQSNEHE